MKSSGSFSKKGKSRHEEEYQETGPDGRGSGAAAAAAGRGEADDAAGHGDHGGVDAGDPDAARGAGAFVWATPRAERGSTGVPPRNECWVAGAGRPTRHDASATCAVVRWP